MADSVHIHLQHADGVQEIVTHPITSETTAPDGSRIVSIFLTEENLRALAHVLQPYVAHNVAKAVMREMPSVIRGATGIRTY